LPPSRIFLLPTAHYLRSIEQRAMMPPVRLARAYMHAGGYAVRLRHRHTKIAIHSCSESMLLRTRAVCALPGFNFNEHRESGPCSRHSGRRRVVRPPQDIENDRTIGHNFSICAENLLPVCVDRVIGTRNCSRSPASTCRVSGVYQLVHGVVHTLIRWLDSY
jgi:hypothetical protein